MSNFVGDVIVVHYASGVPSRYAIIDSYSEIECKLYVTYQHDKDRYAVYDVIACIYSSPKMVDIYE